MMAGIILNILATHIPGAVFDLSFLNESKNSVKKFVS